MNLLRRRLLGLAALVAILAIIIGLPAVLFAVGANPFADGVSWGDLTRPDDGSLALAAIKVIAWIAWGALTISLLVEIVARVRGIRPPRMPGLALPQGWAQGLVGAAVALFAAAGPTAAVSPPASAAPLAAVEPGVAAADVDHAATDGAARSQEQTEQRDAPETVAYTVQPNDSLWSIAEQRLGDGNRFTELVALNADLLGGKADFLKPGWVLTLPASPEPPAAPADDRRTVTVQPGDTLTSIADAELGDTGRYREIFDASTDITQPDGARLSDPDLIQPGWTLVIPGVRGDGEPGASPTPDPAEPPAAEMPTAEPEASETVDAAPRPERGTGALSALPGEAPTPPAAVQNAPDAGASETAASGDVDEPDSADAWKVATGSGIGTILAAGAIAVVARRRGAQQRRRKPGQTIPMPEGSAATLEQELRTAADELAVQTVDDALRGLARQCSESGEPLPGVRAARLTVDRFELYLEEPEPLPAPWQDLGDGSIWALDAGPALAPDSTSSLVPAPYPALVTVGHDDTAGHIFLNLERIGSLGVTGTEEDARAIVAALTLELATSVWADDLQVTVVGWFADVEGVLRSGRIRWVPTIDRLLDQLAERADSDRQAIAGAGVRDLGAARSAGLVPDAWTPEIVVVADFMTESQKSKLAALTAQTPKVAVAAITSGVSVGQWALRTSPGESRAILDPIAMPLTPQRLALEQYDDLLGLVALADPAGLVGDGDPEPSVTQVEAQAPEPELDSDAGEPDGHNEAPATPSAPRLLVLGPVDLIGAAGTVEDSRKARLLELAAYLALHPNATAPAIDDAIWPDRRTEDNLNTRNTATSKLRRWVGQDESGQDFLPRHAAGGGYGFTDELTSDVGDWNALTGGDPLNGSTENLEAALELVRGTPFEGTHRRRYAWSEPIRQRLVSEIVDASYALTKRRLMEGHWRAAEAAVSVGLLVDPAQEALWRLRILAAHESRNPAAESEAVDRLLAITEELEVDLEPETEQLLAELKNPGEPTKTRLRAL
ncbi:LysM peptidoglycan-binding domain-containing protein [Isoptericola sp. S6320L]|uniref:LysM peptidoglycan-binding domain-containing protein n=1 Tax=Isoptericola sp. S6320L TaxID=2926411 RepID=UPI001FF55091|nr:LysM peptidoglycan-binding domain-containing protein [Isoptericola sp. S6320L]MCK0116995.1 LysM peptidoglycan-binding domain-containing protein [Isoptericola sp. S6320L]